MHNIHRVLVIGATGTVGRQVVAQLPQGGVSVRAMTRSPENAGLPPHVEGLRGGLPAASAPDAAADGVGAIFLVWTAPVEALDAALERLSRSASRIVLLSSPHK